jgi:hypothetical protein
LLLSDLLLTLLLLDAYTVSVAELGRYLSLPLSVLYLTCYDALLRKSAHGKLCSYVYSAWQLLVQQPVGLEDHLAAESVASLFEVSVYCNICLDSAGKKK